MEKALLFGYGANCLRYKKQFEKRYQVVGVIDNAKEKWGHLVSSVDRIKQYDYDVIVITTMRYEEIEKQLLDMEVPEEKIIIAALDPDLCVNEIFGCYSYGQHFEDLVIASMFLQIGIEKPTYMDLGANHPIIMSNTALMHRNGCHGINIEANPNLIKYFDMLRPNDTNVNVGVASESGSLPYYVFTEDSGLNTFSREEADKADIPIKDVKELPVITLDRIINEYWKESFPDFLDCDIEGLDYDVLESYDFIDNGPKIACVEVRTDECVRFDNMMRWKGYFRFCRIGENNIYARNEYSEILMHENVSVH